MASLCLCCINGLLENGDVNEIHENGLTTLGNILMRSIDSPEMLQDFIRAIQLLIDYGVDIDMMGDDNSPLGYCENMDIMEFLIDNGANVNMKNSRGDTPLFRARVERMAEILINAGADIHEENELGNTPLLHICKDRRPCYPTLPVISTLLENGSDPSHRDISFNTPLHYCEYDAVKILIEYGADVEETDKFGQTPLYSPNRHHFPSIQKIKALLDNGANIKHYNEVCHMCIMDTYDCFETIQFLVQRGCTISKWKIKKCKLICETGGYCDQHGKVDECNMKTLKFLSAFKIVMCARIYLAHKKVQDERCNPDNLFDDKYRNKRMKMSGICKEWMDKLI